MNAKLIELAERRKILVARAANQRAELSQAMAPWREALAVVDRSLVAVRYIRSYAALLVGVVAFVVPLLPWRMAKWLRRDGLAWRVAHAVKRILPGL
jgi:YqjK-like protein